MIYRVYIAPFSIVKEIQGALTHSFSPSFNIYYHNSHNTQTILKTDSPTQPLPFSLSHSLTQSLSINISMLFRLYICTGLIQGVKNTTTKKHRSNSNANMAFTYRDVFQIQCRWLNPKLKLPRFNFGLSNNLDKAVKERREQLGPTFILVKPTFWI